MWRDLSGRRKSFGREKRGIAARFSAAYEAMRREISLCQRQWGEILPGKELNSLANGPHNY